MTTLLVVLLGINGVLLVVVTVLYRKAKKTAKQEHEPAKKEKKQQAEEKKREQKQRAEAEVEAEEEAPKKAEEVEAAAPPTTGRVPVFAAPSVRQFAREIGVDITAVPGSGPGGRINVDDVKRLARESRGGNGRAMPAAPTQQVTLPDFAQWGEIVREDFTQVRRKTAQHMALCWSTIPHVTLFEKADATDLEDRRRALKERVEKETAAQCGESDDDAHGATLTVTAVLLKLTAAALDAHPKLRASIDVAAGQTIHKHYCHIGVAVDTPRGLVVPVIRDVDRKGLRELSQELADLAARARDGKLSMDDLTGGVFTLTNLGGLGTGYFTPIVNHPQSAILGVGRAATEPVYDDDADDFKPRLMMPLSLSFDHRLIDGADGARFLHWFAQAVENPLMLALESGRFGG